MPRPWAPPKPPGTQSYSSHRVLESPPSHPTMVIRETEAGHGAAADQRMSRPDPTFAEEAGA